MGAWWANSPWLWWALLGIGGAILAAIIVAIVIIAIISNRET